MSSSYLRGFTASASSFLTVLLNLISANPDVLVREKKQGSADNRAPEESLTHCKSEVSVQSLSVQMLTRIISAWRKRLYH